MTQILIVESDTPEQVDKLVSESRLTSTACFERTFSLICDDIRVEVTKPYSDSFKLQSIDFQRFDGVVFSGSIVPWCVDAPEAMRLRQTMEAAFKAEIPIYGSCNGLQLAVLVLGGKNKTATKGAETGFASDIKLSTKGSSHPLHEGRHKSFAALSMHRDHVSALPQGSVVTAGNTHSPIQAMVYEQGNLRFWGTQYHSEYTLRDIIDTASNEEGLFYCDSTKLAELEAVIKKPVGRQAQQLGVSKNDLHPQVLRTEITNWVHSLH